MKKQGIALTLVASISVVLASVSALGQEIQDPPRRPTRVAADAQTANCIQKWTGAVLTDSIMCENATNPGRVGVNTADPKNTFHVFASATSDVFMGLGPDPGPTGPAMNFGYSGATFGRGSGFFNVRPDASAVAPNPSLRFMTVGTLRMIITNAGKVGINTIPAGASTNIFEVNGNANFLGTVTGTNIAAQYQDVAEWVPASEDLAPGTVVVIDPSKSNAVIPSAQAYDTSVAGIVSKQPGIILGERGADMEAIATTGRVKVRVDASKAPIRIGDLLVTSDVPGTAMKSEPLNFKGRRLHQPGTIIGKALEPLDKGVGEILILLSLQ